jgi:hypothetical protein
MKHLFFSSLFIFFVASCSERQEILSTSETIDQKIELRTSTTQFIPFNMPFPEGTTFEIVESELRFTLPDPYYIIGKDQEGNFYRSDSGGSGGVTCACVKGLGCDPIKSGGEYGCLMKDNCDSCLKSKSSIIGVHDQLDEIVIFNPNFNMFVDKFEHLNGKYLLPNSMIDLPEIIDLIQELQANYLESYSNETKITFINAFGYIIPLEIPADINNTSVYLRANETDGGEVCTCKVSGSCPKKTKFTVVWCDSDNCSKCSMSGIVVNEESETMKFTENRGVINLE